MKFAKELEDELVPEWRAKYINYKQGKKKIKAISKALRAANRTPKIPGRPPLSHVSSTASIPYTHYDFNARANQRGAAKTPSSMWNPQTGEHFGAAQRYANQRKMSLTMFTTSPPLQSPEYGQMDSSSEDGSDGSEEERLPLKTVTSPNAQQDRRVSYGSFSPPAKVKSPDELDPPGRMSNLALPDPALDPGRGRAQSPDLSSAQQRSVSEKNRTVKIHDVERPENKKHNSHPMMKRIVEMKMAHHAKHDKDQDPSTDLSPKEPSPKARTRDRFKKIFQAKHINSPEVSSAQQQAYDELDSRQDDFFNFLDKELDKVEKFYKTKEDEARDRLNVLRAQLHEHRDQRTRDMKMENAGREDLRRQDDAVAEYLAETPFPSMPKKELPRESQNGTMFKKVFHHEPKIGKTSTAMKRLASPPQSPRTKAKDDQRDYTKKKPVTGNENVPHKFAKRRLKLAMQEFYRGMELLKSYALLNRTGFRKINKKYDKAVNARPPLRYLNEKVTEAHFVRSTLVDEYLVAVEDLYARYFERGNRKMAVSKLRSNLQDGDHSASSFRNGLYVAAGVGFAISGLVDGINVLEYGPPEIRVTTSYLLQMYAGYFLALLLVLIFVLDCRIWTKARINYIFVFEFDTRHVLDWRQLAEIPCFLLFLNGLFLWLNFQFDYNHAMYHYWPAILYGITVVIIALPFKVLYYHSRKWWGFSNFRLLFAGIYPVEFRDFFLGDMYCSETYTMSQIVIFFCTYRWNWNNPARCNSNHSMLLGFFTCLPAVWRSLQCLRRYKDSGNWFPHLANFAKYMGNILYYMSLSLYRLHVGTSSTHDYRVVMIVFASLNGVYCSLWDVFMDWSLGNFFSKNKGLRDNLGYRRKWLYYAAIVFNTLLRHQWIAYAIFTEDLQHSAGMSFFVGLAEVLRRGVWTLFRVENEHTNNVANFRASRDIPLPYSLPQSPKPRASEDSDELRSRKGAVSSDPNRSQEETVGASTGTDRDLERQSTHESGSTMRRRMSNTPALRALQRVGTAIAAAHAQDFEKRRRPEVYGLSAEEEAMVQRITTRDSSDDEDDEHHPRRISGSVANDEEDDDNNDTDPGLTRNRRSFRPAGDDQDNGGEGSSGESQAHERPTVLEDDDEEEERERARMLTFQFHPEQGITGNSDRRGGGSSKQKKT